MKKRFTATMTIKFEIEADTEEDAQEVSDLAYSEIVKYAYVEGVCDIEFLEQELVEV